MKLTLFTISNEQIKEQLSKLQTKVESLETVKEVQDKIIATKDSQISFLNDQIANIWASVSIAATIIIFVFGYVAWLNKQAQNKVEKAESLIRQNQQTATIAQEKLEDLEKTQVELDELTELLSLNQRADMVLKNIKIQLGFIANDLIKLHQKINNIYSFTEENSSYYAEYTKFKKTYESLNDTYTNLSYSFNRKIIANEIVSVEITTNIGVLDTECRKLKIEVASYYENYEN
ncbi:TPA: hypothetical protein SA741_005264 [Bacillus cereus]|uniref:hypothetical protein n=1 Tax=Bacillus TaxID=1386 RepID=UPI00032E3E77|nr:hypothetical protein [Bacillus cereus]MCU7389666.1 hypothetical protein [Bacillus sp. ST24]EKS8359848.1 hypothetical protein [Bacillus cereus]MDA2609649.1 hypothetical protein [Bacillus cereus]PFQ34744.1 hypothetical protein COK17_16575 [Bacillus cereus]PGT08744.1 hypothetical protein COD03_23175 [Bacillus cereus]